ncbi:MAG: sporulation protein YunB [Clostridia bacterium]|nr:sporulation protein YunB [Clostridia bacterium]
MKTLFLKRAGRKRRLRVRAVLVILAAVFILGVILYERLFDGKIEGPATNLAVTTVERMIAEAAAQIRGDGAQGGVGDSVEIDSAELNEKRETFEASLEEKMRENGTVKVRIPLGTLIGGRFLSGKGPRVPTKVYCDYKTECEVKSDLLSVGINQTMYTATLTVSVDCTLYLDTGVRTVTVKDEIILEQMMFIGGVPLG